jgi:hypothetical protein
MLPLELEKLTLAFRLERESVRSFFIPKGGFRMLKPLSTLVPMILPSKMMRLPLQRNPPSFISWIWPLLLSVCIPMAYRRLVVRWRKREANSKRADEILLMDDLETRRPLTAFLPHPQSYFHPEPNR